MHPFPAAQHAEESRISYEMFIMDVNQKKAIGIKDFGVQNSEVRV